MVRLIVGAAGLLAALFPDRMVDVFERVAVENPDDCSRTPWIAPGIRAEGVLVVLATLVGGRAYAWLMNLTGVFGAVLLVVPGLYREVATAIVYERPDDVAWNDRFTDGIRVVGGVYLLWALLSFRRRGDRNTD